MSNEERPRIPGLDPDETNPLHDHQPGDKSPQKNDTPPVDQKSERQPARPIKPRNGREYHGDY
ncbi:MAG: hypothetical protein M3Q44_02405 [bacterium]|nr:hypothetical protein [bacterium]